ncbi:DegQ family serine endoprotease [Vreelandella jeotgali]|uniref:DegQ family serine endoprotease n=1 Tax=Vreelandella jeotgali TaxID=553386 RepID=UPI00034CF883|nr:DegQ family serine endoprotease [Halomonas jeotgali]
MKRMILPATLWLCLVWITAAGAAQARELPDFTQLVKQAAPAVVNISTTREVEQRSPSLPHDFNGQDVPEIFRHFFGDRFGGRSPSPHGGGPGQGPSQKRQSLGSGFVISEDGYIMTNAHVVRDADKVQVRFNDRREMTAKIIGSDSQTDIALIKVDAEDLTTLEMGDSDELEVGNWVAAIGSPFGFDHSVTSGIISAMNRTLPQDAYVPFIQTDVAINPGNSGGPLFNLDGQVIGINSQIFTRNGGFMGLSFAIPVNVAMDVADQLRQDGKVDRGWLGVMIQPVSRDLAESFGMDKPGGALIADLDPEGPAAAGGLKAGDVILAVNGQAVKRSSTLPRLIGRVAPDEEVTLSLLRDGEKTRETVTLGSWPESEKGTSQRRDESASQARLGVAVSDVDPEQRKRLEIDGGVQVRRVKPGSVAASAGIKSGDILVSVDHQAVMSADDLVNIVQQLPDDRAIPLRLYREGRSLFVALRMP